MKYYFIFILFNMYCLICKTNKPLQTRHDSFTLSGNIIGRDTGWIVLWYPDTLGVYIKDTAIVKGGKFEFKGFLKEPSFAHLLDSGTKHVSFYLEGGKQTVSIDENKFDSAVFNGSNTQSENASLDKKINQYQRRRLDLTKEFKKADSSLDMEKDSTKRAKIAGLKAEIEGRVKKLYDSIVDTKVAFISSHPNSYVSPTELLSLIIVSGIPLQKAEKLYNGLSIQTKESIPGLMIKEEFKNRAAIATGSFIPDFKGIDLNNREISINQFKSKYVLLDFWASWCAPCREQLPHLKEVYNAYHSRGFEIVGISSDKKIETWKETIKQFGIQIWPQILYNDQIKEIFKSINTIPQQILLDRTGKIIWSSLEENKSNWEKVLKEKLD